MKKIVLLLLVVMILLPVMISGASAAAAAPASCLHPSYEQYWKYDVRVYRPLGAGSPAYAYEHTYDLYDEKWCYACNTRLLRIFDVTMFEDHSLPCSKCGAR